MSKRKRGKPRNHDDEDSITQEEDKNTDDPEAESSPDDSTPVAGEMEGLPKQWTKVPILELAKQGWWYRKRTDRFGTIGMWLRNRNQERSLGHWSPEAEKKLFELYPILYKPKGVEEESPPDDRRGKLGTRPFFNVPIKRIPVIPSDYRPSIDVIRYYNIFKNNDYPGDFSDFINGVVLTHFVKCNGVVLPVFVDEELTCNA